MKALLASMMMLLPTLAVPATAATPLPAGDPVACADLSLEFIPTVVLPEHTYDYNFDLVNCGNTTERLVVHIDPFGPCRFIPASKEIHVLEPGEGFGISRLMIAPSCPGDYRLKGVVRFRGRALDRDAASLRVEAET